MTTTATIVNAGEGRKSLGLSLPDGDLGTDCTAMAMRAVAEDAAENSRGVQALSQLLDVRTLDHRRQLPKNLYEWLRAHCRFKRDGRGLEHIRHPDQVLAQITRESVAQIDCDCLATLAAAVLLRCRYRPAFVVVGRHAAPAPFAHVFYATYDAATAQPWRLPDNTSPPKFVPFDPQERTPMGEMPEGVRRFRIYPF